MTDAMMMLGEQFYKLSNTRWGGIINEWGYPSKKFYLYLSRRCGIYYFVSIRFQITREMKHGEMLELVLITSRLTIMSSSTKDNSIIGFQFGKGFSHLISQLKLNRLYLFQLN